MCTCMHLVHKLLHKYEWLKVHYLSCTFLYFKCMVNVLKFVCMHVQYTDFMNAYIPYMICRPFLIMYLHRCSRSVVSYLFLYLLFMYCTYMNSIWVTCMALYEICLIKPISLYAEHINIIWAAYKYIYATYMSLYQTYMYALYKRTYKTL